MPATEIFGTLGKKVFLPLVALCVVGVLSAVSFAGQGTTGKAAAENSTARIRYSSAEGKIKRAGRAAGRGIKRAAKATERGVRHAGRATGKGIKRGGEAVEKTFSGKDSTKQHPRRQ